MGDHCVGDSMVLARPALPTGTDSAGSVHVRLSRRSSDWRFTCTRA